MLLNWARLWIELKRENDRRGRHPLADPLEGAEWCGLLWTVPLFSLLTGGSRRPRMRKDTRRPPRGVSVSGWSRSSAGRHGAGIPGRSAC